MLLAKEREGAQRSGKHRAWSPQTGEPAAEAEPRMEAAPVGQRLEPET